MLMSKSAAASATKLQLSTRSAWSKGPPQSSAATPPRTQSPAPAQQQPTHSRRPSTLGGGVPIKDGVTIPRGNASAIKAGKLPPPPLLLTRTHVFAGSAVTFGSIDDDAAPISSSPAAAPVIKSEGVKSFGTLPADTPTLDHVNGKPSSSSHPPPPFKPAKMDIHKLFQNPSSAPSSSAAPSPSLRPSSLPPTQPPPPQHHPTGQPQPYPTFVPASSRPHPNSGQRVPSSPVYQRQMPNGSNPRPPAGPSPASSQLPASPRMAPHPHPQGPPTGIPPQNIQPAIQQQYWPYYVRPHPISSHRPN
ncbi:hypothetical protein H0H87_004825 [Tephrocybe sp. NHM501043]|nr:hypothetical protein H0H87_004825 [Tephrocybe sp. NHM501043]